MDRHHRPFWFLVFTLITLLIIRDLFRDGMFMDGLFYVAVSKNLANALGTFWHPHFSQTLMSSYHQQPPLLFGLEALFFKAFGNSMYVERFYCLLISFISFLLIMKLWNYIFEGRDEKKISWLPLFLVLCIPVYSWSFVNNMEEPTMSVFDISAVFYITKVVINRKNSYFNLSIAAFMLIAASMCKGIQALFPIVSIFFYRVLFKNISLGKVFKYTTYLVILILIFYALILLNDQVLSSYKMYFNNRLVTAFLNPASSHTDRFYIIKQLFSELLPLIIVVPATVLLLKAKRIYIPMDKDLRNLSLWFFTIGLSGTLPLMLTMEQSGYYLVTVMPYYAIGFAVVLSPSLTVIIEKINESSKKYLRLKIGFFLLFLASLVFSAITILTVSKRDQKMLHDIHLTGNIIPQGSIIGIPESMYGEWSLHGYYSRYYNISLDASAKPYTFFLIEKELDKKLTPPNYILLNLPTLKYDLYTLVNKP